MRLVSLVSLVMVLGVGCRQENPDWMGPDPSVGDATTDGSMTTAMDPTDPGPDPPMCADTETLCGNNCRDLMTDRRNCGECGNVCTANTQCMDGVCG